MKKHFPWVIAGICLAIIPTIFVLASYIQWNEKPVTIESLIENHSTVTYKYVATPDGIVKQKTEFQLFDNFIYVDGAQEVGMWCNNVFYSETATFEFVNNQVNVTWYDGVEWVYYNK